MPKIEEDASFLQREEDDEEMESKLSVKDKIYTDDDMDGFFENTSEKEFDEYMQNLEGSYIRTPISDMNPSGGNPSASSPIQYLKQKLILKLDKAASVQHKKMQFS